VGVEDVPLGVGGEGKGAEGEEGEGAHEGKHT
jgi:hypothetical protein